MNSFINISERSKKLYNSILGKLKKNLNGEFKRVEASRHATAADEDIYENIFNRATLDQITDLFGWHFPSWGDIHAFKGNKTNGEQSESLLYGKNLEGKYVPVGLRLCGSGKDWINNSKAASAKTKTVRTHTKNGNVTIFRPQIVCVVAPLTVYRSAIESNRFSSKAGGARKLLQKKMECHPRWGEIEINPIRFYLPTIGKVSEDVGPHANGVEATEKSRHFYDDEKLSLNPANLQKLCEDDAKWSDEIDLITRKLYAKWQKKGVL